MDIAIYAGYTVIWCVVWAVYYIWARATGKTGLAVYLVFLGISGVASLAYYAAVSAGFSAYYWKRRYSGAGGRDAPAGGRLSPARSYSWDCIRQRPACY